MIRAYDEEPYRAGFPYANPAGRSAALSLSTARMSAASAHGSAVLVLQQQVVDLVADARIAPLLHARLSPFLEAIREGDIELGHEAEPTIARIYASKLYC